MPLNTEAEAAQKWCPATFLTGARYKVPGNAPEGVRPSPATTCIGSKCMAWRWGKPDTRKPITGDREEKGFCGRYGTPL